MTDDASAPPSPSARHEPARRTPIRTLWSRVDRRRLRGWLVTVVVTVVIVLIYGQVVAVRPPSSQAAEVAVVVAGVDPPSGEGLRVDVIARPVAGLSGCDDDVDVRMVISGTPAFWRRHAGELRGDHTVGIGLRTAYDDLRLRDWSGYALPDHLRNLYYSENARVPEPRSSGRIDVRSGEDTSTGVTWYVAEVQDWGTHRTPLVMEFSARWTSARGTGSCYVVLPELVGIDGAAVDDARAAAYGAPSVFDAPEGAAASPFGGQGYPANAVTFGRVIVRTGGRIADEAARPAPRIVDGNPWASDLGEVGEEAAVWTCEPSPARDSDDAPPADATAEAVPDPAAAAHVGCGGLAVVESRNAGQVRDIALLVIGALFAFLFERVRADIPIRT